MKTIQETFPIGGEEFKDLHDQFSKLTYYASWQLTRKNTKNNHQCDIDDFQQDLLMSVMKAGSYFKRQVYIERCLALCWKYAKYKRDKMLMEELQDLWDNRTRHGANRQKFGPIQERCLDSLVRQIVPKNQRPSRKQKLVIDSKFATYCKQIIWNTQRAMGKKITREKPIRANLVSLSEWDFLIGQ